MRDVSERSRDTSVRPPEAQLGRVHLERIMLACVEDVMIDTLPRTLADNGAHFNDLGACAEDYCGLHFFGSGVVFIKRIWVIICERLYKFLDRGWRGF